MTALNAGRYLLTGSSMSSFPSSCSIIAAVATIGFVIDAIEKRLPFFIGVAASMSARPTADK